MIRPEDCGDLPKATKELCDKAEKEIDSWLIGEYDPQHPHAVKIETQTLIDIRCLDDGERGWRELIKRYEDNGWQLGWREETTTGHPYPTLIGTNSVSKPI